MSSVKKKILELEKKKILGTTINFKVWLIALLILLASLRLFFIIFFAADEVVSQRLVLSAALLIMSYIWFQENYYKKLLFNLTTELADAYDNQIKANLDTLKALFYLVEAKDQYTSGHCKRVTEYAIEIAKAMKLDKDFQEVLRNAASIHDIGKIGIPDTILNKTDKLNEEEWRDIRMHPELSIKVLEPLKFLEEEKKIILHHHEKIDGSGYPNGLKGKNIPLGARILAVADTFDAMNSTRAYRTALSPAAIKQELKNAIGTQLDSEVTTVFLQLLEKNPAFYFSAFAGTKLKVEI
jgi:putative nucleotidyltransferase with HDIG domain